MNADAPVPAPRRASAFKPLCAAYILTLPVVHAFAPSLWIPLPMDVLLLFIPLYALHVLSSGRIPKPATTPFDVVLILLVAVIYLSTLLHLNDLGQKQFNHLLSYVAVVAMYYFVARLLLQASRMTYDEVMGWLTVSVLVAAGFGLAEFAGKNFLGFDVDDVVPRPEGVHYISTFAVVIVRSRSFMSESANFASLLDMLTPILVVHWWQKGRRALCLLILAVVIPALVTTFSAAASIAIAAGVAAAAMLYLPKLLLSGRGVRGLLPLTALGGIVVAGFGVLIAHRDTEWGGNIVNKLLLLDPGSAGDRLQRWNAAVEMVSGHPWLGAGAGSFLNTSHVGQGIVSWPLQIAAEGGLVAVGILASLFLLLMWRAVRIADGRRYAYVMALCALAIHYTVISDYWMPWIWFLVLMLDMVPVRSGRSRTPLRYGSPRAPVVAWSARAT